MKALLILLAAVAPISLQSVEISLPLDETEFTGPDADLLNANCTACHSASMVLFQPHMDTAGWAGSVKKMREIYKAPIEDIDAARLPEALVRVTSR